MINTRLIQILKTFTPEEIKEFKKFITSPFFNKEGNYIVRYFEVLKKHYPAFNSPTFTKELVFKKVYPRTEFNSQLSNKMNFELQKLAEEYLRYTGFREHSLMSDLYYLRKLNQKKLYDLFEKKFSVLKSAFDNIEDSIDKDFYRLQFDYEVEKVIYYTDINKQEKTVPSIRNAQRFLTYDFLINMLDVLVNIEISKHTNFEDKDNVLDDLKNNIDFEGFKKCLSNYPDSNFTIFEIFYSRYLAYTQKENDEYYFQFKELLFKNLAMFPRKNQYTLILGLQNICINKMRSGKRQFQHELFEVHKEMISRGLYASDEDDFINLSTFRNIFITALNMKEYDWAENFITEFNGKLAPDIREDNYLFASASIKFARRQLEGALEDVSKVKFSHYMSSLDVKSLMLKIYYEMNQFNSALDLVDAYRHIFTSKRKNPVISDTYRHSNLNFLNFLTKLVKIKSSNINEDKGYLIHQIKKTETILKDWLIEKVEEL